MNNQKGFNSLTLMIILPLLLVLLSGTAFAGRTLYQWNGQHHQCHLRVIRHQNELRQYLLQLLRLNPTAKALLVQQKAAQAALAAAIATTHPAAISTASARLKKIKARQTLLKFQQQSILQLARASAVRFRRDFKTQFKSDVKSVHHAPGPHAYPLAVRPVPPSATAPEYIPVDNFSKQQNIGLSFQTDLSDWKFLLSFLSLPNEKPLLKIECGSTLKQENGKWYSHLSVAKPLLKL